MAQCRRRVLMEDEHAVVHLARGRSDQDSTPLQLLINSGIERGTVSGQYTQSSSCESCAAGLHCLDVT